MPTDRTGYRADVEALRGLAVLLVIAYHAGVPGIGGGFVGVDIFFVLSGYFTGRTLVQEYATTGAVDVRRFYARRASRLLPPLLLVAIATLIATWTLWAPIDRSPIAATARSVVWGIANVAFAREGVNYFNGARSPFLHAWSLAVELQLSLFGPVVFAALAALGGTRRASGHGAERARRLSALIRGVGFGLLVIGALSLGYAMWATASDPSSAYFGTLTRAWELVAGALLALVLPSGTNAIGDGRAARGRGWWLQCSGLAAILIGALGYDRMTPYPGSAALLPVVGSLAVIAGGARRDAMLRPDARLVRLLGWFGMVSYSWYLWHWPIIVTASMLEPALGVWGRLALSAAALGPAWLTYRFVERPMRDRRGEEKAITLRRAMVMAACCLTLGIFAGAMQGVANRRIASGDQRTFAIARGDRMAHGCWAGVDAPAPVSDTASCAFGDPNGRATVVLFGDSHAEHWLAALDRLGRERGWRVVLMVMGGCPVADAPELIAGGNDRRGRECARYRRAAVQRLIALKPDIAILSSFDEYVTRVPEPSGGRAPDGRVSVAAWQRGLERTYSRIAGAGIPVVAIRGTPRPGFDVPACLSRRAASLPFARVCEYDRAQSLHGAARGAQLAAAREVAARGLRIATIDLTDAVCATKTCGVVHDGVVVFTDDNHLTASFTRAAAPALGDRLDAALTTFGGAVRARLHPGER